MRFTWIPQQRIRHLGMRPVASYGLAVHRRDCTLLTFHCAEFKFLNPSILLAPRTTTPETSRFWRGIVSCSPAIDRRGRSIRFLSWAIQTFEGTT